MIGLDANGKPKIAAIKLSEALHVDGKLDEQVYEINAPFGELTQVVPKYGAPVSERTDIWVMYDTENIYVTCRCWDSAGSLRLPSSVSSCTWPCGAGSGVLRRDRSPSEFPVPGPLRP